MEIIILKLFFIIIFFLSYFTRSMPLNDNKRVFWRKLDGADSEPDPGTGTGSDPKPDPGTGTGSAPEPDPETGSDPDKEDNLKEECSGTAYEPTDCFEIEFDYKDEEEDRKCCFMEYKDKGIDNKRKRICKLLTNDQFLDIKKTIKSIKDSNKNYTVFSLECDKSKFLSLNKFLLLILLIINL